MDFHQIFLLLASSRARGMGVAEICIRQMTINGKIRQCRDPLVGIVESSYKYEISMK